MFYKHNLKLIIMRMVFFLFLISLSQFALSQEDLARFSVKPVQDAGISAIPVSLESINYNTDFGRIALFEKGHTGYKEVACQLETGTTAKLWFLFDNKEGEKEYVIRHVADNPKKPVNVSVKQSDQVTTINKSGLPVLSYNHAEVYPPEGIDAKFRRSAFIHPLWSPGGEVLTRIQPPDHYHHYGIWNPWTRTTFNGNEVDFWNLGSGQGTVRFKGYLGVLEGPVFAGFRVLQEHVAFLEPDSDKLAINELWDVRVWETDAEGITIVDLSTTLNTPLTDGIMLNAYRYGGGLGYRATEKWHKDNCTVLTSEGKNRADADGTNARWGIVEGESGVMEGRSGIIFLSHPSNRMHPEPMRVWPLDANGGRGDMFFEFCPIRHEDWMLEQGRNYTLKYRMILFDGEVTPDDAERYWRSFASSPAINFY